MLGKLIKYEWKSLSRQFLVMLAILAGTTLVSSLIIVSINFEFDDVNENYSLFMLIGSVLIYYLGLIVCSIGTSLIVAIRFYKSCYTDAAYLTHTLPVSARQLVGAKTIASCLIQFLSSITVFLSIIVYFAVIIAAVLGSDTTSYTGTMSFAMLSTEFQQSLGVTLTQYCVFLIGYSLVGCITGCCILLGCVSLGQLYTKHRILGAILAYFIVTMIMQVITYLAMLPAYGKLFAASAAGDTLPLMSFMMLSMVFVMITFAFASAKRICEVLDEQSDIVNPETPVYTVKDGSVDFDNVSFKYSKKAEGYALSDIDLHIKSGETIGIIGGTGSSKSSLINLIPRLYDATCGSVKVGGVDVKEYDLKTLRDNVSVVLQKNLLFSGTIAENIRWGDKNASDEEVERVCKLAQAEDFIKSFPDGYNSRIEQGGTNVSGGQKQRLCIARALLKKPAILILDDSTSAVDTHTDALIRKAFAEEIPNTTKIIIAQRVASVQDADKIIVMDGGKINGMGTHEELLKSNEIYREVFETQNRVHQGGED